MIAAVVIAMIVMYVASGPVAHFIAKHPTTKMLALAFLVLIGVALVADGFEFHIPRGYIYLRWRLPARSNCSTCWPAAIACARPRAPELKGCGSAIVNKVLLVTGASRGIGAATAKLGGRARLRCGGELFEATRRLPTRSCRRCAGPDGVPSRSRATWRARPTSTRMFAAIDKELGRLTHLVYNAGTTGGNSRVEAVEAKTLRDAMELNVLGALLCAKAAILRMSKKHGGQGGAMVLISSMAASLGSPGEYVWYAASKGAIDSMTIGLSKELAGDGIRVNAVSPGHHPDRHPSARPRRAHCADRSHAAGGHRRGGRRDGAVPALRCRVLHHRHECARCGWAIAAHRLSALLPCCRNL